jgi:hypothetical protein
MLLHEETWDRWSWLPTGTWMGNLSVPSARALGDVGLISSVTQPFCAHATGRADSRWSPGHGCCAEKEVDLLTPLRAGANQAEMRVHSEGFEQPWGYGLAEGLSWLNRVMSEIGG